MHPVTATYITVGFIFGAATAINLFIHSSGSKPVIAGIGLLLWAGLIPLWPLGMAIWLYLEVIGSD